MPKKGGGNQLSWISLGFALASIHYGLGFLVGSGESVLNEGPSGILYAVSTGIGLLALAFLAGFYRERKSPIWDLLGDHYGKTVGKFVLFLSSFWMIGVVASQILGGAAALTIFKIPQIVSMIIIALGIYVLSILDIGKLSKVFFYMLLLSSFLLLLVLFRFGFGWFPLAIFSFLGDFKKLTWLNVVEVGATTVLVTVLGMDFHQFVVKAKSNLVAKGGCFFGGVILLVLSFVLLAIFQAGINMGIDPVNKREFVPLLLRSMGNKISPFFGVFFCVPVILVSIGSGSGVTKVVSSSLESFVDGKKKVDYRLVTVMIAFFISLVGKSIVSLIVSFYAIYVAAMLVPFVLYYLDSSGWLMIPEGVVRTSIFASSIAAVGIFLVSLFPGNVMADHQTVSILSFGLMAGVATATVTWLRLWMGRTSRTPIFR